MNILQYLGIVQKDGNVCPSCRNGKKESNHVFLHYDRVYKMWSRLVMTWGMNFVGAENMVTYFYSQVYIVSWGLKMVIWRMAFSSVIWPIWMSRSQVVFQHENFKEDECFERCCFNLVWWVKAKQGDQVLTVVEMIRSPECINVPSRHKKMRGHWI